jgi:hydroxymethylpyrimidine/phosphomethylpyrimidine kinase
VKSNTNKILIIAASDSGGGAGVQADLKTISNHNIFAASVITSLTAQNTKEVLEIFNPPKEFLRKQLEAVLCDIKFNAIKIGMLANSEIINEVANAIKKFELNIPIILDPVMVATSGDKLFEEKALEDLKNKIIKNSFIITPNIDEAEILSNIKIRDVEDMKNAAEEIQKLGVKNVLIKGGHLNFGNGKIQSLLLDEEGEPFIITNKKIKLRKKIHGTGCTLASAIAANITSGLELLAAVKKANDYVYRLIKNNKKIGAGSLVLK